MGSLNSIQEQFQESSEIDSSGSFFHRDSAAAVIAIPEIEEKAKASLNNNGIKLFKKESKLNLVPKRQYSQTPNPLNLSKNKREH